MLIAWSKLWNSNKGKIYKSLNYFRLQSDDFWVHLEEKKVASDNQDIYKTKLLRKTARN